MSVYICVELEIPMLVCVCACACTCVHAWLCLSHSQDEKDLFSSSFVRYRFWC